MKAIRWSEDQYKGYLARQKRERSNGKLRERSEMPGVDIDAIHGKRPLQLPQSKLERRLDQQIAEAELTEPVKNYFFLAGRDLELDRAWPKLKIGVEVQGMAHRIKGKFRRDIEKRALAMLAGWRVLEVDGATIRDGRAIKWLKTLLERP